MATPHDSLVKRVFTVREDAIGELRSVLPPEIVEALDLDGLEVEEGSFVDPALVQRHLDLLYSVPLKSGVGSAYVYVLFEHQSSDDPLMVFRLLAYMVRIWEQYLRDHEGVRELPVVVPLVLHHAEEGWRFPKSPPARRMPNTSPRRARRRRPRRSPPAPRSPAGRSPQRPRTERQDRSRTS